MPRNVGISSRVVEICALVTSVAAVAVAVSTEFSQRRHMRLSVTPIPTIISTQTREEFSIDVLNQGVGPLIVQGISFVDKYGNRREAAIVEAEYQAIVGNIVLHDLEPPSAIAAGEKRSLIRFLPAEGNASEQLTNQALRADTDELKVVVKYTDVYETRFENYVYTVEKQDGADVFPVN